MPNPNLQEWLEGGVSLIVGTVDAEGVPTCCRAFAITTKDDFETVTVYVPAATGQETMANVATTRRMAISCTKPVSHSSIQIKGITRGVKLASPEDEAFVTQRLHDFADVLDVLGLPRKVTHRMAHWPAFAIDVTIEQLFDQTPGPRAGNPIA